LLDLVFVLELLLHFREKESNP